MTFEITGGYDPITKNPTDAEYHYKDGELVAITSATGITIALSADPNKWTLSIKLKELSERTQATIQKNILEYLTAKGADKETASFALSDASITLFCKGFNDSIVWEERKQK